MSSIRKIRNTQNRTEQRQTLIFATISHALTHTRTQHTHRESEEVRERFSLVAYKYLSFTRLPNDVLCLFNQLMWNFLLFAADAFEFYTS